MCAILYRALAARFTPAEVDAQELWQLAAFMGKDIAPPPPRIIIPPGVANPDAPRPSGPRLMEVD